MEENIKRKKIQCLSKPIRPYKNCYKIKIACAFSRISRKWKMKVRKKARKKRKNRSINHSIDSQVHPLSYNEKSLFPAAMQIAVAAGTTAPIIPIATQTVAGDKQINEKKKKQKEKENFEKVSKFYSNEKQINSN